MRTILISLPVAILLTSCANPFYRKIDKALDVCDRYEKMMLDSLERLKSDTSWEGALELADAYSHFQIDSCLKFCERLRSTYGTDKERMVIGESQIAQAYRLHGDYVFAKDLFESIDTSGVDLSGETGLAYYYTGYYIHGGITSFNLDRFSSDARKMAEQLKKYGPDNVHSIFALHQQNIYEGRFEEDLAMLQAFLCTDGITRNAKAKTYNYLSQTYQRMGNDAKYMECKMNSILLDIELSVKNYNSLFDIGVHCYNEGDYNRARRYIIKSLQDAQFCNQPSMISRSIRANSILNDALVKSGRILTLILSIGILLFTILAIILFRLLSKERKASRELAKAKNEITDLSNIKDTFISSYMEQCAEYINKLDQNRSKLRQIARTEGVDQLIKELRSPAYSDKEFIPFLKDFDRNFLKLFPDFMDKLDSVMKEGKGIKRPKDSTLSTEVRIMALIRLGIDERSRIANILHTSIGTVYTYHSIVQNNSTIPADRFDSFVKSL